VSAIAQIAHTRRPLDNRIPIHGNKSAVVTALCQPRPQQEQEAHSEDQEKDSSSITTPPLMWNVTRKPVEESPLLRVDKRRGGAGYDGLSAEDLEPPQLGKR